MPHRLPHAPAPSQAADCHSLASRYSVGSCVRPHLQSDNGASLIVKAMGQRALPRFPPPTDPGLLSVGAAFHSGRFQTPPRSPPARHTLVRQLSHRTWPPQRGAPLGGGVEPLRWVGLFRSSLDSRDSTLTLLGRGFFPLASLGGPRGPRGCKLNPGPPPRLFCGTTWPWIHG